MIRIELYEQDRPLAILERSQTDEDAGAWARFQEALARGIVGGSSRRIEARGDVLLSELDVLREVRKTYSTALELGPTLQTRLRQMAGDRQRREEAITGSPLSASELEKRLLEAGFQRRLKPFQVANLSRIFLLPHAADFSVPGAGKTSVALGAFALYKHSGEVQQMLVVAPLTAFSAWKDDLVACFVNPPRIGVHLGPGTEFPANAEILLTNYHRLAGDYDRLRQWSGRKPTQVVLDEAHRVKRGRQGVHGRAALDLAFVARRRDVLTGTPAPQGAFDLVALVRFLYPGQERQILPEESFVERFGRRPAVLAATNAAISRYFVRTRKSDLDLPPTSMKVERRPMGPVQEAIYRAVTGRYLGTLQLADSDRQRLRQLGNIVMYLLEAATNPMLLTAGSDQNDLEVFAHPPIALAGDERIADLLRRYSQYERPWKYDYVRNCVTEARQQGSKILVWTSFVRNIRILQRDLAQWKPAIVHGGIPPEDGAPPEAPTTREKELDRFRNDADCTVLLANPAACGEGVSLHHWCHHAIYLDRTFNAGHFLQSQDRIHRLGLQKDIETKFTLLVSEGSIDEIVNGRLVEKVVALSTLMNDPGLVQVALPDEEGESEVDSPAFGDDVAAVMGHLAARAG